MRNWIIRHCTAFSMPLQPGEARACMLVLLVRSLTLQQLPRCVSFLPAPLNMCCNELNEGSSQILVLMPSWLPGNWFVLHCHSHAEMPLASSMKKVSAWPCRSCWRSGCCAKPTKILSRCTKPCGQVWKVSFQVRSERRRTQRLQPIMQKPKWCLRKFFHLGEGGPSGQSTKTGKN